MQGNADEQGASAYQRLWQTLSKETTLEVLKQAGKMLLRDYGNHHVGASRLTVESEKARLSVIRGCNDGEREDFLSSSLSRQSLREDHSCPKQRAIK